MQITTPSEVLKFFKVDSAGLEKNKLGEEPATKPETDKDTFV
jgi:hypothetical protein